MLTSVLGIRLILMLGKTVPLPASSKVTGALSRVEVTNDADGSDGFQMTFSLSKEQPTEYNLIDSGALEPFTRVIIGVLLGATPEVLIDGVITHHQLAPGSEPGAATLTVTGKDISMMLDLEERNEKYENQPDYLIVMQRIAAYAQYGMVPQATATTDVPLSLERIPRQFETDLKFIQTLAERNGFVFYVEPLSFGVNTAYWGPENRLDLPQSALNVNMGDFTNVTSLNFSQDALAPVSTQGTFVEPITKLSLPIPSLPSLLIPPLAASTTAAKRTVLTRSTANQNPAQAALSGLAASSSSPPSVTADGDLETVRYGHVLRARKLVGVRGVGFSYGGNYFVRRVTHNIARGEYTQKFTLSREGTGTLGPVLRP